MYRTHLVNRKLRSHDDEVWKMLITCNVIRISVAAIICITLMRWCGLLPTSQFTQEWRHCRVKWLIEQPNGQRALYVDTRCGWLFAGCCRSWCTCTSFHGNDRRLRVGDTRSAGVLFAHLIGLGVFANYVAATLIHKQASAYRACLFAP